MLSKNSVYWLKSFGICLLLMAVALDADVTGVVQEGQISPISHVVQHKNDLVSIEQLVAARQRAGHNSHEIERALSEVPHEQRRGMQFLIVNMPLEDLQNLTADFLLENCDLAYQAWEAAPWHDQISEAMFFDTILPYACINERRDAWRRDFHDRFS